MNIASTRKPVFKTSLVRVSAPIKPVDAFEPEGKKSELWRDFGINPKAMFKRAFVDRPLKDGTPLNGGKPCNALVVEDLKSELKNLIDAKPPQDKLQSGIAQIASRYGVTLNIEKGVPLVNWDQDEPGVLDVRHSGGAAANHELVHAIQCTIGGAAAFGTAAAEKFQAANGRAAQSLAELSPYIQELTKSERAEALAAVVKPMEDQAYSTFEESAFHATGMMGKRSKDQGYYLERLNQVVEAYTLAYVEATVPELETTMGPKIYGGIGHIARTNGETALLLGGAGLAYYQLAKQAMRIHPLMGIPVATPLAYLLYRATVSG